MTYICPVCGRSGLGAFSSSGKLRLNAHDVIGHNNRLAPLTCSQGMFMTIKEVERRHADKEEEPRD